MVSKEQKREIVAELGEKIRNASALYFVDFAQMTVDQDWALRKELKAKGIEYRVAKNTFILRALKEVGGPEITAKELFGQTAVDRKSTRLNSSHIPLSRMPSSA